MIFNKRQQEDTTWLSVSDLMTVLMAIFLIIAVLVTISSTERLGQIEETMDYINEKEKELCRDLGKNIFGEKNIFRDYERGKDIKIQCNPIKIIFTHEDFEFVTNEHSLKEEFKNLLKHFWPLYIETVKDSYIYPIIDEIRIEGHADPDYTRGNEDWKPYTYNIDLSQKRSREVLMFIYNFELDRKIAIKDLRWIEKRLTANGLSYSRPLEYRDGECKQVDLEKILDYPIKLPGENEQKSKDCSRRVEIVLRTNSLEIFKLLEEGLKLDDKGRLQSS